MTRLALLLGSLSMLVAAGCGDDGGTPTPDAPVVNGPDAAAGTPDAPPGPDVDAAPGTPDAAAGDPDAGKTPAVAPTINSISWATSTPCTGGTTSTYTITWDVDDPDTASDNLTYSGSIGGCSGTVTSNPDTITCPNFAPYTGTLTVTDDTGLADSQSITIGVCSTGSAP